MRNISWNQWITKCNNNINSAEVWRNIKAAKGTSLKPPTHPRSQEEADSPCDSFAQRCSPENSPKLTNNILTNMVPERVRTITTATNEAVDTDQEFNLTELVKFSAQSINPYSLGFRSGVETIYAIETLIHTAAPITALRRGYKSCSATIFLDLKILQRHY